MNILPFETHHASSVAALTNEYILNTAIHFSWMPVTEEDVIREWQGGKSRFPWLVAQERGAFAGFSKAGTWRTREAYNTTVETAVYVEKSFQRKGVGRALYESLLSELRARGFHLAVAGITLPNDASVKLHEAVGFEHVGTFRECGRKFDQWHDVGFWQARLDSCGNAPA